MLPFPAYIPRFMRPMVARLLQDELRALDERVLEIERRLGLVHEYIESMEEETLVDVVETELGKVMRIRIDIARRLAELDKET